MAYHHLHTCVRENRGVDPDQVARAVQQGPPTIACMHIEALSVCNVSLFLSIHQCHVLTALSLVHCNERSAPPLTWINGCICLNAPRDDAAHHTLHLSIQATDHSHTDAVIEAERTVGRRAGRGNFVRQETYYLLTKFKQMMWSLLMKAGCGRARVQ